MSATIDPDSVLGQGPRRRNLTFKALASAGFRTELLPIIPPDAELSGKTRILPNNRGKVPGVFNAWTGEWSGIAAWAKPDRGATDAGVRRWDKWRQMANIGLQTRKHPTFDLDISDKTLSSILARELREHLGWAPRRNRGESRCALVYKSDTPLEKRRVAWRKIGVDDGAVDALEMLGAGQQVVIEGRHPSGDDYTWEDDKGLPEVGADGLTAVSEEKIDHFFQNILPGILECLGYEIVAEMKGSSADRGVKYPIGDGRLAGDPDRVVEALEAWPNDIDDYHEWIAAIAAIKAALSGDEAYYEAFEDWCLQFGEDNTPEKIRGKWDSVSESSLGADYVFKKAAAHGFNWAGVDFAGVELPDDADGDEVGGVSADDQAYFDLMRSLHGDAPTIEEVEEEEAKIPEWVKELNSEFFVVNEGGQVRVIREAYDYALNRPVLERLKFDDFRNLFMEELVCIGSNSDGDPIYAKKGKAWLESQYRRQFKGGMVFAPNRSIPHNVYNMWRGFAVEAIPGDWSLYRRHLLEIACKGVEEHYNYLIRWMARAVQHPDKQGEVAAVLKGRKGAGKGTVIKWFGRLFGTHFLHITNAEHLVGRFNSALRDSVVVFADEAFWAGDKKHESVLKGLITEDMLFLEGKFRDPVQTPNFVHLLMASNEDWVVPASSDERRFFVLEVDDQHQQDESWFSAIEEQMSNGGLEALFHDLLNMDLSDFSVRRVPSTAALTEQKLMGLSPLEKWWFDHLRTGVLPGDDFDEEWPAEIGDAALEVPVKDISAAIEAAFRAANVRRPPSPTSIGISLRRLSPSILRKGNGNKRVYVLPPLGKARGQFAKYLGGDLDWDNL